MVTIEFLGPIKKPSVEIEAKTLLDVAKQLKEDKEIQEWLPQCAVALNDTMVNDLSIPLKNGDRISILPPVCGG